MNCPACRTELPPTARSCPTCGSVIAFAPEQPKARLGTPLAPWEQEAMQARRPSVAYQAVRPPVVLARPRAGVPARRPGSGAGGRPWPRSLSAAGDLGRQLLSVRGSAAAFLASGRGGAGPDCRSGWTGRTARWPASASTSRSAGAWRCVRRSAPGAADDWLLARGPGHGRGGRRRARARSGLGDRPRPGPRLLDDRAVALPQQAVTALPVAGFLLVGAKDWPPRTFLFAGALSGLAFAAVEAVLYPSVLVGGSAEQALSGGQVWQLLCGVLVQGCSAAAVAYFIAVAAQRRDQAVVVLVAGSARPSCSWASTCAGPTAGRERWPRS